jgi:hypothetical protein
VIGTPVIISFGTHNIQDLVTLINGIVANQGFLSSTIQTGSVRLSAPPATTLGNPTITIGSPAVVTLASHGLTAGDVVAFTTTGALPTGITPGVNYYVLTAGLGTNTFEFSTTAGGTAINTTGTQSGTHTLTKNTPVAVSSNDYRISPYEVDTGTANTFVITVPNFPAAYAASQTLVFKALNANTGVSTLNVNGLGNKTIHKNGTLSLVANDIVAGQIVEVIYDGTNFQMTTPTPQTYTNKFSNGTTTKNTADASTVQTIAHSLGIAPSRVNITAKISTTSGLNEVFEMFVTFDSSGTSGLSTAWTSGTAYISGLLTNVSLPNVSSNYAQTGVITVDATNIYITWTRSGVASGIIYNISWKAEY